ncbi:MAG TPA: aldolase [Agromyces sp.]|nr:aldolase [Agromyces sp.]
MRTSLVPGDLAAVDERLAATDELLAAAYPGDDGSRQAVHTVYVPADRYTPELPALWGRAALVAVDAAGGLEALGVAVGLDEGLAAEVAPLVRRKLEHEPIEDLRIDFEDGYGDRGDAIEDTEAIRAAKRVIAAGGAGFAPPFLGIRFKSFEAATRARGIRTLDLFVTALLEHGSLPEGLALTLPKVSTVAQVQAMADVAAALERSLGLPRGRPRFEVQVETPQLILGADGISPVARLALAAPGRISGIHYGTYDYSAALGVAPRQQSMDHPAADFAKQVMQVAVAGTGIRLSDGSTNILPVGDGTAAAWRLHARLVHRSLERGFAQGWDLHAHQLPTRFLATYAFYREGYPEASARLRHRRRGTAVPGGAGASAGGADVPGGVLDEPATVRALAGFVLRGLRCGAIPAVEVAAGTGLDEAELIALAHPRRATA